MGIADWSGNLKLLFIMARIYKIFQKLWLDWILNYLVQKSVNLPREVPFTTAILDIVFLGYAIDYILQTTQRHCRSGLLSYVASNDTVQSIFRR